jgi:hydroxypyruvate isomerase
MIATAAHRSDGPPDPTLRFDANLKWLFPEVAFEERFAAAADCGFHGVEFASPYRLSPQRLQKLLADHGLVQVLINTPGGPAGSPTAMGDACVPASRIRFRSGFQLALEYATALSCNRVHVMAGVRPEEVSVQEATDTYLANLQWAAEQARDSNVELLIEAVNRIDFPNYFLGSEAHAVHAIDMIGMPNIALLFDIYHCRARTPDVLGRLELAWPHVGHIQVADHPTRAEPGTGVVDWREVFSFLRDKHYAGWCGCEYEPAGTTAEGLVWVQLLACSELQG